MAENEEAPPNREAFQLRLASKNQKIEALEVQLAELKTKHADTLNVAERANEYKQQLKDERAGRKADGERYQTRSAMSRAGITDPGDQDLASWAWGRLGDEQKQFENIAGWLAHEEGARTHKHLAGFFADGDDAPPPKRKIPDDEGGAKAPPTPQSFASKRERYRTAMAAYSANPTDPAVIKEYNDSSAAYFG